MKSLVSTLNQEKALVGAFSMIVKLRVIFGHLRFKLYSPLLLQDPGQAGVAVELGGGLRPAHEGHGLRHGGVREILKFIVDIVLFSSSERNTSYVKTVMNFN